MRAEKVSHSIGERKSGGIENPGFPFCGYARAETAASEPPITSFPEHQLHCTFICP